jgi:hypothetical protein
LKKFAIREMMDWVKNISHAAFPLMICYFKYFWSNAEARTWLCHSDLPSSSCRLDWSSAKTLMTAKSGGKKTANQKSYVNIYFALNFHFAIC